MAIKDLAATMAVAEKVEDFTEGEPLKPAAMDKLQSFQVAMKNLNNLIKIKQKGFAGAGVDVGPIAKQYPTAISSLVAKYLDKLPEKERGSRAQLRNQEKWFTAPIRKDVTGAQAAIEELRAWILPMVPHEGLNDDDWRAAAATTAQNLASRIDSYNSLLQQNNFRTPKVNTQEWLKNIDSMLYPKGGNP